MAAGMSLVDAAHEERGRVAEAQGMQLAKARSAHSLALPVIFLQSAPENAWILAAVTAVM